MPFVGTFTLSEGRFDLLVDDLADTPFGDYRVVWDVSGDVVPGQPDVSSVPA